MMGSDGTSLTAIKLFEAQVIPALLFNCESWIDLSESHINDLQGFQDNFLRKLMHLPISTPKAILHWDGSMQGMRWRIAVRKLQFLRKLMKKEITNICRRAVANETIMGVKGLGHECMVIAKQVGLPDLRYNEVSKGEIKRAVLKHSREVTKREVEDSRKVGDRAEGDKNHNNYLSFMSLSNCRIWMRVRARSIKGVKVNNKRSFVNLSCRFCATDTEESQEHLETCNGCKFERRNLNMSSLMGRVNFWRRMTTKFGARS